MTILERNRPRLNYIHDVLLPRLEADPARCMASMQARILAAGTDIFGADSKEVKLLQRTARTGGCGLLTDLQLLSGIWKVGCTSLGIKPDHIASMLSALTADLVAISRQDIAYFAEEGFYGFWGTLEDAGMSHEDIGRYFERFKE